jgi:hypothetical protein
VVDHGVTASFIKEIKGLGFDNLAIEKFVRMQDHGVTPAFIKKMRAKGFADASVDELIRLADHGSDN